jgi:uncharacterized alpha-E superfamily protein
MLSRVANNIYWMSRYLERVEHTARVVDVNLVLQLDQAPAYANRRWERLLHSLQLAPLDVIEPQTLVQGLVFDRESPHSIVAMLGAARDNARQVRNQLSSEMWEQINRLYLQLGNLPPADVWSGQTHALLRGIKEGVQLFHGITDTTLRQDESWHFLRVGRFIERAHGTLALLDAYFGDQAALTRDERGHDYLDWVSLLKSRTAFEAYCQVYTADLQPARIAAFLLLNPEFPHSVRFAAARVQTALATIASVTNARKSGQIERIAGKLRATFEYAQIDELIGEALQPFLRDTQRQYQQLHALLHDVYFEPPIEAVLAS